MSTPTSRAALDSDLAVVGAGVLGLATALAASRADPRRRIAIFDKEASVATHQSGRNSGVIHAGVYYEPGSAKAELCRRGRVDLMAYCRDHAISFDVCGKLIVATRPAELDRLDALLQRCRLNGIEAHRLMRRDINEREPHVDGLAAIHVPSTAIVDYGEVCAALAADLRDRGVSFHLSTGIRDWAERDDHIELVLDDHEAGNRTAVADTSRHRTAAMINCAGLHADRVAALAHERAAPPGDRSWPTILPFRGEYFDLVPERRHLVRGLVYPVPDPALPFLGVHVTRDIHGGVHAGPNAVLALGREAYGWGTFDLHDVMEIARTRSTWRLARRYATTELDEVARSLSRARFVDAVRQLVPDIRSDDLVRARAGIRAQAVAADGTLVQDFMIERTRRATHVLNAPSPAATAALAIGAHLVGV